MNIYIYIYIHIYICYCTQQLHVSAIYPGHLQGVTSVVDMHSVCGTVSYTTGTLYTYVKYNIINQ